MRCTRLFCGSAYTDTWAFIIITLFSVIQTLCQTPRHDSICVASAHITSFSTYTRTNYHTYFHFHFSSSSSFSPPVALLIIIIIHLCSADVHRFAERHWRWMALVYLEEHKHYTWCVWMSICIHSIQAIHHFIANFVRKICVLIIAFGCEFYYHGEVNARDFSDD